MEDFILNKVQLIALVYTGMSLPLRLFRDKSLQEKDFYFKSTWLWVKFIHKELL